MEFKNYDANEIESYKNKYKEFYDKKKSLDDGMKQVKLQTSLLNVDSISRNLNPKNITENNNIVLSDNPISTKIGDNTVKIKYPKHNFNVGDFISINNIKSFEKTLSNSLYLIDNVDYLIINIPEHGIPSNYKDYVDEINIDFTLISTPDSNFYNSIPINMILGLQKIVTWDEFTRNFTTSFIDGISLFNTQTSEYNSKNYIFTKLEFSFTSSTSNLFRIQDVYKIRFLNLNGIPLNQLNSDYPINFDRSQGYQEITSIETDFIYFTAKSKAYKTSSDGGENITISKITKSIAGFPNAGEFILQLRKNFTNIVRIEIVSSEFPFSDYMVRDKLNNKLYWQHLDDGDTIYSISIPSGNYNSTNLIDTIKERINKVTRVSSTPENRINNIFEIEIDTFTNKIEFKAFANTLLPNSISDSLITLNNKQFTKLDIKHPRNFVNVDDEITISNAESVGNIPKIAINKTHIVYSVNRIDSTYSILLEPFSAVTGTTNTKGGPSVRVKSAAKVRFLFNYKDTLGNLLNFPNPGDQYSVTKFNSVITNFDDYVYNTDLDSVGNKKNDTNFIQLTGSTNYWLLYLNDIESVILSSDLPNCFAKILLPGTQGDIMFNSFVNNPVEFETPIPTLSELNIKVTDSLGNIVDFENTNFSFTLKIFELVSIPRNTGKLPQNTSFLKEYIENNQRENL